MANSISAYLTYTNLQLAAESLFGVDPNGPAGVITGAESMDPAELMLGNKRSSKFTSVQAQQFIDDGWTVVEHEANTSTGFSGTLFRNNQTGEQVLSFRSTEFIDDAVRDNQETNRMEIQKFGWGFGQIDDMKQWVDSLYAAGKIDQTHALNVTGYSLGGHLATAFNLLYPGVAQNTYTFNGAGVGVVNDGNLIQVISQFDAWRKNTDGTAISFADSGMTALYAALKPLFNGTAGYDDGDSLVMQAKAKIDTYFANRVGPDASDAQNTPQDQNKSNTSSAQNLTYKAAIALDSQVLQAQGENFKLVPGMQVIAEINQGRRGELEYLLSPLKKTLQESGHER